MGELREGQAVPVERRHLKNWVDLSNIIQQLLDGAYASKITPEVIASLTPDTEGDRHPEAELKKIAEFWEETSKPERLALTAILITAVWHDPEFAQARENFQPHEEARLDKQLGDLFMAATTRVLAAIQQNPKHELHAVYTRLKIFTDWSEKVIYGLFNHYLFKNNSPENEIKRGIYTAQHIAWGLVDVLETKIYEKRISLSKQQKEHSLRRAFRSIGIVLASLHKDVTVRTVFHISDNDPDTDLPYYFKPEFFDLVRDDKDPESWILVMNHELLEPVINDAAAELEASGHKATRCPAMYAWGNFKPPIMEYFNWILITVLEHD